MKAYEFSRINLELDTKEANELYDAISRVVKGTTPEMKEKFADQDKMIFMKVMEVLKKVE